MVLKKTTLSKPKTVRKEPKDKFDYKKINALSKLFCTPDEISDLLGLDKGVLEADEKFKTEYKKAFAEGQLKLRKSQMALCKDKNVTIVVWLGKIYLAQREKDSAGKELDYDLTKLPDFYLQRIIKGEDHIKVINEFENASANSSTQV